MNRNPMLAHALLAALATAPGIVRAADTSLDVPSPQNSTVPVRILACPKADLHCGLTIRGYSGLPLAGSWVILDFSGCPGFVRCPLPQDPPVYDDAARRVNGFTNAAGFADFTLTLGRSCDADTVRVYADGIFMGTVTLASVDQDANLSVDEADVARVTSALGSGDRGADFDGNGTVTAADVTFAQTHLRHYCDRVVPVRPSTWGSLKLRYR
jgi:hypothetical protein